MTGHITGGSNSNTNSNINTSANSNNSRSNTPQPPAIAQTRTSARTRGSSFNSLWSTFGIRQQQQQQQEQRLTGNTPFSSNLNSIENLPAHQSQSQEETAQNPRVQLQMQSQPHIIPRPKVQLPISLSLTTANPTISETSAPAAVSASDSALANENNNNSNNIQLSSLSSHIAEIRPHPPYQPATTTTMPESAATTTSTTNDEINNNVSLKNLRHFVYGPDQKNVANLLQLDLAPGTVLPEPVDDAVLQTRKTKKGFFSIRLTPFIDSSATTSQGLFFDPVLRTAGPGSQLVIGRYTERVREAISKIPEHYHPVVFKSKVVSRTHGSFKVDEQGNWFIRDVKSSSGTFLNHQRLAPASTMSKDVLLHDGDILQLGMDFRGGTEEIYRCVRMRVELNRSWKLKANAFNKEALQRIKNLQMMTTGTEQEEDCSICLSKIRPCQAIFISPCAHSWHFHCIRRLVMLSYPQFVCPNCRSACDLEAALESSDDESESEIESEGDQLVDHLGPGAVDDPKNINIV
ncbi:hypothetical protein NCAS_0G02520 [Naumovozyma castellii]|uniref:RING-type E3 ubiquitin transferase n=1 Tax=Naumovozyma castellii TaxID=27288 RepID=G0VIA4_NAUCA|nr:hypothetical protein NCAS_0G02520 [Naumovozyma castellii CBS 4309]CCC71139.1 hypothetical protein NCAS_0G02520 [Naumovozyma castellii CBS 4309]